jgi:hypothetical protein
MMKKIGLLSLLLLLASGVVYGTHSTTGSQPAPPPDEVAGVMEEAFAELQKQMTEAPRKYGFSSAKDVERATVETGYPIFVLDEPSLPNFKGNIYQLEEYGYAWEFVIHDGNGEARTFMQIAYDDAERKFMLAESGGDPAPLMVATAAMRAFAGEQAKNVHLVKTGGERLLIFEYKYQDKLAPYALPLTAATTDETQPFDYIATIEYIKKINGLAHDEQLLEEQQAPKSSGQMFLWIALFAILMIFVVRLTNNKLRKEREQLAEAEKQRLERRRNLKP